MTEPDRYLSFCNINCDENADKLIEILNKRITTQCGDEKWHTYFNAKQLQQQKMSHDNLHFIGNQLNMLYQYFNECEDEQAIALLYQLEQECC